MLSRAAFADGREQLAVCVPPGSRYSFQVIANQLGLPVSGLLRAALAEFIEGLGDQIDPAHVANVRTALADKTFRHGGRSRLPKEAA